jgi:pimeloyl-ACP methyl ester carboxylesterase
MPKVKADHITMNLEQQETGEPQILIPYLAADYACCASRWPSTPSIFHLYLNRPARDGGNRQTGMRLSTELFADGVAAFMQAVGIPKAHISGLPLGAASGTWLAAKYPNRIKSLSVHSRWPKTHRS